MKLWLVSEDHVRFRGGWTDYSLVIAESEKEAVNKVNPETRRYTSAEEICLLRLAETPFFLGESGCDNVWHLEWTEDEQAEERTKSENS